MVILPFPECCSDDTFSSLPFSYSESLLCLLAHTTYSTSLIPLPTFMNKILLQFSLISQTPPISHPPLEHSHIPATQPQIPPHILPAKYRSSSSRQLFLTLPASRENRNSNQERASLGGKNKKPHPPASPTTTNTQQQHCLSHHTLNSQQLLP